MKIRIKNAKILTMDDTDIREGEIWVCGDRIAYVGPAAEAEEVHAASSESVMKDGYIIEYGDSRDIIKVDKLKAISLLTNIFIIRKNKKF